MNAFFAFTADLSCQEGSLFSQVALHSADVRLLIAES
jgi:hypothetical protein